MAMRRNNNGRRASNDIRQLVWILPFTETTEPEPSIFEVTIRKSVEDDILLSLPPTGEGYTKFIYSNSMEVPTDLLETVQSVTLLANQTSDLIHFMDEVKTYVNLVEVAIRVKIVPDNAINDIQECFKHGVVVNTMSREVADTMEDFVDLFMKKASRTHFMKRRTHAYQQFMEARRKEKDDRRAQRIARQQELQAALLRRQAQRIEPEDRALNALIARRRAMQQARAEAEHQAQQLMVAPVHIEAAPIAQQLQPIVAPEPHQVEPEAHQVEPEAQLIPHPQAQVAYIGFNVGQQVEDPENMDYEENQDLSENDLDGDLEQIQFSDDESPNDVNPELQAINGMAILNGDVGYANHALNQLLEDHDQVPEAVAEEVVEHDSTGEDPDYVVRKKQHKKKSSRRRA